MEISKLDSIAKQMAEIADKIEPLNTEIKALKDKHNELEEEFIQGLIEHNKKVWNIDGRKPYKLSTATYYNVKDPEALLNFAAQNPSSCSVGYLGQAVRSYFNELTEKGYVVPDFVASYTKNRVTGGQAI